ncbi:hypothetical protein A3D68_00810 [Candidatus Adlerbacteria bacterium RIFCSPHIGHO2_02_FULL_52_17]|uniref:Uncharacterized protein n=1 Tax=Candidatus Adlerbacteria bacterium RIFCSPHIGHO2_02_FULL_52_17 TaxID=1797240 RepID=A0A1F4XMW0_9BACT|nr:MAG: hypothetical protein A3D68_00810 [Candidatus Adlerbacteria bacterium RIFCSPHIGHO2_02_FULL_52_17]
MRFSKNHAGRAAREVRKNWRTLATWVLGGCFLFGGLLFVWAATLRIPDLSSIENRKVEQSAKIYDRTGTVVLYDLNQDVSRTLVPLASIAADIQYAIIAIEDPGFYLHGGIDPRAILRAILADITPGGVTQGGSTITQQVVKSTILTGDKTITRKLKEWILAVKLERVLSKDQILELYLNQVPMGGSMYGVEEASGTFFNKHAQDVSIAEAAYLAAILPAPTYYSPYGNRKAALDSRKNLVLDKMYEHGYVTQEERDLAKAALVTFEPRRASSLQAPHFVFFVRQYLEDKYGQSALQENGWKITTTLDSDMQARAEEIVRRNALENTDKFNASNAGLVAINPQTGEILSMVGSRYYFDTEIDGAFNVTASAPGRQPGSAFKPFAYAEAFIKGYTPDTVLFDLRTQFQTTCPPDNMTSVGDCYSPTNYDDKFRGPMTMREALAQSINVPSVKVLYLAGISDTLRLAKSMGITTLGNSNQYGLTLVLGGGEVTPLDITSAYGVFANNGVRLDPIAVIKVENPDGSVVEDNSRRQGTQVLPKEIAEKINDILSDPVARAPLGENHYLSFPGRDVAVKTGTTNDYRDAWTIGYTPNMVMGIWVGNNDNSSMVKKVSGFIVGPMWHEFMQYALSRVPVQSFTRSEYDNSWLKPVLRGVWQGENSYIQEDIEFVTRSVHSILHWVDKSNPNGLVPQDPTQDSQYERWEYPVRLWAQKNNYQDGLPVPVGPAPALPLNPFPLQPTL